MVSCDGASWALDLPAVHPFVPATGFRSRGRYAGRPPSSGRSRTSVSESIPANPAARRAVGQLQQLVDVALAAMIRGDSHEVSCRRASSRRADGDEAHRLALPVFGEQPRGVVTGHEERGRQTDGPMEAIASASIRSRVVAEQVSSPIHDFAIRSPPALHGALTAAKGVLGPSGLPSRTSSRRVIVVKRCSYGSDDLSVVGAFGSTAGAHAASAGHSPEVARNRDGSRSWLPRWCCYSSRAQEAPRISVTSRLPCRSSTPNSAHGSKTP